jgi:hypothetical protein
MGADEIFLGKMEIASSHESTLLRFLRLRRRKVLTFRVARAGRFVITSGATASSALVASIEVFVHLVLLPLSSQVPDKVDAAGHLSRQI